MIDVDRIRRRRQNGAAMRYIFTGNKIGKIFPNFHKRNTNVEIWRIILRYLVRGMQKLIVLNLEFFWVKQFLILYNVCFLYLYLLPNLYTR